MVTARADLPLRRRIPDVAVLVLLAAQLPIAVMLGLGRTVEPWYLVPVLFGAMPVDAMLGVVYAVGAVKALRGAGGRVQLRLQMAGLLLSAIDVVAITWVFGDSGWA